jgi:hypothetical protein
MPIDERVRLQYESDAEEYRHLARRFRVFIEGGALAADFDLRAEELEALLLQLPSRPATAA